jgi:subtilisin family serine protease
MRGGHIAITSRAGEPLKLSGLDSSGLKLISVKQNGDVQTAIVFASRRGLLNLKKRIRDFKEEPRIRAPGRGKPAPDPKRRQAELAQGIHTAASADVADLWRSPMHMLPAGEGMHAWEVWVDNELNPKRFKAFMEKAGAEVGEDVLPFPEVFVIRASATLATMDEIVRTSLRAIWELRTPGVTAASFDGLPANEQRAWVEEAQSRIKYAERDTHIYVTVMDTGVGRAHPLIQPLLSPNDRFAARFGWDEDDHHGHGTKMAGLAGYGDLRAVLETHATLQVSHRLESVMIVPKGGVSLEMQPVTTQFGVDAVEARNARQRVFQLATTNCMDSPHSGAPTSWSTELDQLAAGVSGKLRGARRLFVTSVGNADQNLIRDMKYLPVLDHDDNELESPAQAWNPISVGAYTTMCAIIDKTVDGKPVAEAGDLSPWSRTASWNNHWPIKPDVVLEGGNLVLDGGPPPLEHEDLSLLTLSRAYPTRSFSLMSATSAATALAAGQIAQLWDEYPLYWPETIRALYVSSARWTKEMLRHCPDPRRKGDYEWLFRRYGYGVPDLDRARRSARSAFTYVIQDEIQPYERVEKSRARAFQAKYYTLPMPVTALRLLETAPVKLRVTLSTFIAPNPAESARGTKFGYASHNLRFKLCRENEPFKTFDRRINEAAEIDEGEILVDDEVEAPDGWTYGRNRRDVGSIQIDEIEAYANSLAVRPYLAVHPISGWWKQRPHLGFANNRVRYALIIELDAGDANVDLYAEASVAIEAMTAAAAAARAELPV